MPRKVGVGGFALPAADTSKAMPKGKPYVLLAILEAAWPDGETTLLSVIGASRGDPTIARRPAEKCVTVEYRRDFRFESRRRYTYA